MTKYIVTLESEPCFHGLVRTVEGECVKNGNKILFANKFAWEYDNKEDAYAKAHHIDFNDDEYKWMVI